MSNSRRQSNNFELIRVVETNNKPVKQGVVEITKDENGLIVIKDISLNNNNEMVERVKLTANSFHKALVENITASNIELIDQILEAVITDAEKQANINTKQHLTNRLNALNNAMADFKQNNINIMKDYIEKPKVKGEASIWDEEIDIYNLSGSIPDHNHKVITAEVVEGEKRKQSLDI